MQSYEYLTVPAPLKGAKIKGLKTASERFAYQLTLMLNQLAGEGWEFWRAETLPSEERKGLTGTALVNHNLLIFRRPSAESLAENVATERRAAPLTSHTPPAPSAGGAVYATRAEPALRPIAERD
ncbi:MAG: hypothetical protein ACK4HW_10335 [Roseinatronobacter sp.]